MNRLMQLLFVCVAGLTFGQLNPPTRAQDARPEAQTKTVDPSGTWRWQSDRNGESVTHQLKIELNEKNEAIATYYGLMDGLKSDSGSIEGNKLKLEFNVKRDDLNFKAVYDATIKDDKATGTLSLSSERGNTDIPWEAERTLELSDVVGTWQIRIDANGNILEPSLTIIKKGDKFEASYKSPQASGLKLSDLRVENNKLMFTITAEINGNSIKVDYAGRSYGNKMQGTVQYDFSGNRGEVEFKAHRQADGK